MHPTPYAAGVAILAVGLILPDAALAQPGGGLGAISSGNATFAVAQEPTGETGGGPQVFFGFSDPVGGMNHIGSAWWWYRIDPRDSREYAFASSVSASRASTSLTYVYQTAAFRAVMEWRVLAAADNAGELRQTLTIENPSDQPLRITLFNYVDLMLAGTPGNDSAIQTEVDAVRFTDGQFPELRAVYQSSGSIRVDGDDRLHDLLTDGFADVLFGGVVDTGPGDLGVGSEFALLLGPGESQSVSVSLVLVPAPGAAGLFAVAAMALAPRPRRPRPA